MLTEKMQTALNGQLNAELYSSYLYLSMNAYFKSVNLDGFANWMHYQAQEELEHSLKFYDFILQRAGTVQLQQIDAPPSEWSSPLAVFEATLEHEQKVTGLINGLVDVAHEERDHATNIFLKWFVSEQVEEEASADEVVQRLKLVDKTEGGLFLLDQEMDKRTFVLPLNLVGVF